MPFEVNFRTVREFALNSNKLSPNYSQVKICVEFSWTVGSASTIENSETCCSLNALLQF